MTDVVFRLGLDASQADAQLQKTRGEVRTFAGGQRELQTSVAATSRAIDAQRGSLAGMQTSLKSLRSQLGPTSAALSLVGQSLDESTGKVGEFVKGGLNLAAAFGSGGPIAVALVAGTFALGKFNQALKESGEAQDEAFKNQWRHIDSITEQTKAIRDRTKAIVDEAKDQRTVMREQMAAQMRSNELLSESLRRRAQGSVFSKEERSSMLAQARAIEEQNRALAVNLSELARIRQEKEEGRRADEEARRAAEAAEEAAYRRQQMRAEALVARLDMEAELGSPLTQAERDKQAADTAIRAMQNLFDARAEIFEDTTEKGAFEEMRIAEMQAMVGEMKLENDREVFAKRLAEQEKFHAEVEGLTIQHTAMLAGASQDLIADLISGQDFALEQFGLRIMAQAGQALVSYGTQLAGASVVSGLTGNVPLAAAQGAGAAALVGSGVALGGVSAGVLSNLTGSAPQTTSGASFARGSSGTPMMGGTQHTTIIYSGATGPERDQGARNVVAAWGVASSRNENYTVRR